MLEKQGKAGGQFEVVQEGGVDGDKVDAQHGNGVIIQNGGLEDDKYR